MRRMLRVVVCFFLGHRPYRQYNKPFMVLPQAKITLDLCDRCGVVYKEHC